MNQTGQRIFDLLRSNLPDLSIALPEARHLEEPRGRWQGAAAAIARPGNTQEVSALVQLCSQKDVPVVPYGGGTGLVGGQIKSNGDPAVLLSLDKMDKIRAVYDTENVLIAEAGAILQSVQEAASDHNRLFPLSLASEGSARIGGVLGTNAGGVNVIRYGNARDLCLGIEAVLPNGDIWNGLTRLRKDNTGYDLRNLMIGSEGTLGVITAAALKLFPVPKSQATALFTVASPQAALDLLTLAKSELGETISAFELIHQMGFDFLAETLPNIRPPFDTAPEWCVLIDIGCERNAQDALGHLFEVAYKNDLTQDGVVAMSEHQRHAFWHIREAIPTANRMIGSISSHDISLPLSAIPDFIPQGNAALAKLGAFRINCFGHLGDGNLHYNVFPQKGRTRKDHENQRDAIKRTVHDLVHAMGGSVSAEHGIGRLKTGDLQRYGDPAKLAAMAAIKRALDPKNIMNPGVIFPED